MSLFQRILPANLLLFLSLSAVFGQIRPPNLVVVIVAEQFRADYLDLLRPEFSAGGFERLLTQGAVYRRCRYDHLTTLAAPNAATLATGAYPEIHGIVADRWFDQEAQQVVYAVGHQGPQGSPEAPTFSAQRLNGSTFADELQLATGGGSRVISISDRPGPAVLLGGRSPLGCFWMGRDGRFETSANFRPLPAWAQEFNTQHSASQYEGQAWTALRAPEGAVPLRVLRAPEPSAPNSFFTLYHASPFAVADTLAFARRAIEAENLGRGTYTDLVVVNLSAPALLGHETGAESPLMRDMVLQIDRMLAEFLTALDEQVGLDKTLVVYSGGHGLPPLPENARRLGMPAGRVSGESVVQAMNTALAERFGPTIFVEKYVYPFVYLNEEAHSRPPDAQLRMITAGGEAARRLPGVAGYYSPRVAAIAPSLEQRLRRSWYSPRSGDFLLVYEPYYVESYSDGRGTASGSLYRYDTDVPLVFLGRQFKAGHFAADVDATSVAPTLSTVLGIPAPSSATGTVLGEAIVTAEPPPSAPAAPPPVSRRSR